MRHLHVFAVMKMRFMAAARQRARRRKSAQRNMAYHILLRSGVKQPEVLALRAQALQRMSHAVEALYTGVLESRRRHCMHHGLPRFKFYISTGAALAR